MAEEWMSAWEPDPVTVTREDREAYLRWNMLPPADVIAVRAGEWDNTTGMQVLARHRIDSVRAAAMEALISGDADTIEPTDFCAKSAQKSFADGVKAGLEAAARASFEILHPTNPEDDWTEYACHKARHARVARDAIRSIAPSSITHRGEAV